MAFVQRHRRRQFASLLLSIPLGGYVIDIRRAGRATPARSSLALLPLVGLGDSASATAIARSLDEQLAHQLFNLFGDCIVAPSGLASSGVDAAHWIEGSVRAEGERLRLMARLLDVQGRRMIWCAQYDHPAPWSMGLQDELVNAACVGVLEALR